MLGRFLFLQAVLASIAVTADSFNQDVLSNASVHVTASGIGSDVFDNRPWEAAQVAQPLFYFASGSCYPQAAQINQVPHKGSPPNGCIVGSMAKGCQYQIPWKGQFNVYGPQVPLYYHVSHCSGDNTYRVYYGLYFDHDMGHSNDWEWVVVVWKLASDGLYYRDRIIMEQDGENAQYSWTDSKLETFMDDSDKLSNDGGLNRNHPKVYVAKWRHSMWPNICNSGITKNLCGSTFRPNDFYLFDMNSLQNGDLIGIDDPQKGINPKWNFGSATNPWRTVNGICSMCTKSGGYQQDCNANIPKRC